MIHVLLLFFGFLLYYIFSFYNNLKNYPKGPRPLPFLGNLHQFDWKRGHLSLTELSKEYGNVFTVWLPRPYVVICDYENLKEAFAKNEDFAGRSGVFPDTVFQNVKNGGVIFSDGDNWKEQRRVSLTILRDFGMGKNIMEAMVLHSAEACIDHLKSINTDGEEGIDMRWPLQLFVGNVINQTLFNFSYKPDDCEPMKDYCNLLKKQLDEIKDSKLFFFAQNWQWIEKIPILGHYVVGRFFDNTHGMKKAILKFVSKSREGYDISQEPECFVHAYMQKMETNPYLTEEQLLNVCMDFFLAGMETTTTTLRWAMLFLAKYPEVQEKLRRELGKVVGFSRLATMNDKTQMPYFTATIHEIQRLSNIVPMNVNHRTIRDTSVGGHPIPGDTLVVGLLSNILMNSPVFPSKEEFDPGNFLHPDGTLNKEAIEYNVPFSIGKRICAGEGLARVELFIGLAAIIQNFRIEPPADSKIDLTPCFSAVLMPTPQNVRLIPLDH